MNRKQIVILLVLVAIIGGIGFYFQKRSQSEWAESAAPAGAKVLDFPINDVARIEIRSTSGALHLAKKNEIWVVEERSDYPAAFDRVSSLVRQLWELRPVQQVKVGPSQFSRLELIEPGKGDNAGSEIDLKDKDGKSLAKLVAGKQTFTKNEGPMERFGNMPSGRYVLSAQSGKVALVNALFETDSQPRSWLKRDFVKVDNPASISVAGQTPGRHWTLARADKQADWKLTEAAPNQELDKNTVNSLTSLLASLSFVDVLPPDAKPAEHGLDKPDLLTVRDFDRFTYALKIGRPTSEAYPVQVSVTADPVKERTQKPDEKAEDKAKLDQEFKDHLKQLEEKAAAEKQLEKRIYLIPKSTLDPFLKDRGDLFAKKPGPSATPPTPRKK
jgi:hypothetical protein